ncbi:mucin-2-like [Littorina saxatilis]|uniref:mucin-2-like n=1 Tax=Littorina saxatilis TaxID=31220 RepID=UPI0038B4EAA5
MQTKNTVEEKKMSAPSRTFMSRVVLLLVVFYHEPVCLATTTTETSVTSSTLPSTTTWETTPRTSTMTSTLTTTPKINVRCSRTSVRRSVCEFPSSDTYCPPDCIAHLGCFFNPALNVTGPTLSLHGPAAQNFYGSTTSGDTINICINDTTVHFIPGEYEWHLGITYVVNGIPEPALMVQVNLTVIDVNEVPVIDFPAKVFTIMENITVGSTIFAFNASDPDARYPNGPAAYKEITVNWNGVGTWDMAGIEVREATPDHFEVYAATRQNASEKDFYVIGFVVSDRGGKSSGLRNGNYAVNIRVTDVNEAPQCSPVVTVNVNVTSAVGSLVGRIECWDWDKTPDFNDIQYSPSILFNLLDIASNGNITLVSAVTRDTVSMAEVVSVFAPLYPDVSTTVTVSLQVHTDESAPTDASTVSSATDATTVSSATDASTVSSATDASTVSSATDASTVSSASDASTESTPTQASEKTRTIDTGTGSTTSIVVQTTTDTTQDTATTPSTTYTTSALTTPDTTSTTTDVTTEPTSTGIITTLTTAGMTTATTATDLTTGTTGTGTTPTPTPADTTTGTTTIDTTTGTTTIDTTTGTTTADTTTGTTAIDTTTGTTTIDTTTGTTTADTTTGTTTADTTTGKTTADTTTGTTTADTTAGTAPADTTTGTTPADTTTKTTPADTTTGTTTSDTTTGTTTSGTTTGTTTSGTTIGTTTSGTTTRTKPADTTTGTTTADATPGDTTTGTTPADTTTGTTTSGTTTGTTTSGTTTRTTTSGATTGTSSVNVRCSRTSVRRSVCEFPSSDTYCPPDCIAHLGCFFNPALNVTGPTLSLHGPAAQNFYGSTTSGDTINICINDTTVHFIPGEYEWHLGITYVVNGIPEPTLMVQVNLTVIDVNEVPVIDFPAKVFTIMENITVGSTIFAFNASDPDARYPNGPAAYKEITVNWNGVGTWDMAGIEVREATPDHFEVYAATRQNASEKDFYVIGFVVSDQGGKSSGLRNGNYAVNIRVTDVNEAPQCSPVVTVNVNVTSAVGSLVGRIECWDWDKTSDFNDIQYSPSILFNLLNISSDGNITLVSAVTRDTVSMAKVVSVFAPLYPDVSTTVIVSLQVHNPKYPIVYISYECKTCLK